MRYGADNRYEYRNVTNGILCSEKLFGDPAYGVHKTCEYISTGGGYGNVSHGNNWEYCGSEGGYCSFNGPGEVRYGIAGKFLVRRASNGLPCSVDTFGNDPAFGQKKSCDVRQSARQDTGRFFRFRAGRRGRGSAETAGLLWALAPLPLEPPGAACSRCASAATSATACHTHSRTCPPCFAAGPIQA